MLCHYKYLTNKLKECGAYQADTEDFKQFFKSQYKNIRSLVVELQDGRVFIWTHKVKKNDRTEGGWAIVKK